MKKLIVLAVLAAMPAMAAAQSPLVEHYLHAGEYSKGEQALILALAEDPRNDQIRFGLGILQLFHGVERLGQSLYEYGAKSENQTAPFLRLPVGKNPKPTPVTYTAICRVMEAMHRDLEACEATLAGIRDDKVTLPIRLAQIRFDFDGDGQATDSFMTVLKTLLRQSNFEFLKGNSEFLVKFDRGDVAWLRAYCHLLMGLLDFTLAFDLEDEFDREGARLFAEPLRRKAGEPIVRDAVMVKEPARLGKFRQHFLAMTQLNKEAWKHILAETDDDHEWLPNPKQKGVLGLPVTGEQIDAWLGMMGELEGLLEGSKVISNMLLRMVWPNIEGGLNVRKLLDDPPAKFDWNTIQANGPAAKYLDKKGGPFDLDALMRVIRLFDNPMGLGYMAWFN